MRLLAKNATGGQLARWGWAMALYDLAYVAFVAAHRPHARARCAAASTGLREWRDVPPRGRRDPRPALRSPRRPARSARGGSGRRTAAMTLILSPEPLGAEMAGMAIRATELARAIGGEAVYAHPHAPGDLGDRAAAAGVVVAQPAWPLAARALRRSGARLIYDLYDPEPLEALQFLAGRRAGCGGRSRRCRSTGWSTRSTTGTRSCARRSASATCGRARCSPSG